MKKILFLLCAVLVGLTAISQTINVNPDPNGPPWITGPQPVISQEYLDSSAVYVMSDAAMSDTLPTEWNNADLPDNYFPLKLIIVTGLNFIMPVTT